MTGWRTSLAFFRVVPLHSFSMLAGLGAATLFGAILLVTRPSRTPDPLMPLLLLNAFAVSSGFRVPARRGHFDLLFTGGASWTVIALTHWLVSTAPGIAAIVTLGVVEAAVTGDLHTAAFSSGTIAAVLTTSSAAWTATVAFPRMTGAVAWLVLLLSVLIVSTEWRAALVLAGSGHGSVGAMALAFILNPLFVVGVRLQPPQLFAVWSVVALALASVVATSTWIARMNVDLEVAQ